MFFGLVKEEVVVVSVVVFERFGIEKVAAVQFDVMVCKLSDFEL